MTERELISQRSGVVSSPSSFFENAPQSSEPLRMAYIADALWPNGKTLTVGFRGGTPWVKQMVEYYAHQWEFFANIKFVFVGDTWDADIRILFDVGPGKPSQSNVGMQAQMVSRDQPTMYFGWFTDSTPYYEFSRTTLHEFGHVLGAVHEHASPAAPIIWNEPLIHYEHWIQDRSWTLQKIRTNITHKYPPYNPSTGETVQSSPFDPNSIMIYPIPRRWILNGVGPYTQPYVLSPTDMAWAGVMYPFDSNFSGSLNASSGGRTASIAYNAYTSNFPFQSYSASNSPLPGMCVTKLVLESKVDEILLNATSSDADGRQYMVQVQAFRSWTSCQQIDLSWLEIPHDYPGLQHGVFRQGHRVPSASGNDFWTTRVNFDQPLKSIPKVVVFFTQFYVNKSTNWKASVSAQDIDRQGFTIGIGAAARNPKTNTNYVLTWIAHESDATHIASGKLGKPINQSSSSSGYVDFGKTFSRRPIVLAGLNFIEFRDSNSISIELGTRAVTTRGMDWFTYYQYSPFGAAYGSYVAFEP
ncbi:hypothetical protein C8J56DRAFT_775711 [Mycena floridula]|nr:hypothetical protein C8J56DRAFT_775711 [Mycena floridula]